MPKFAGAMTALVTPFRGDELDEQALRSLVETQIAAGIHGLVPCGTTGESVNLSDSEYRRVLEVVVETAAGRVPVVAGAGSASTRHAIAYAKIAESVGVDGLLVVVPYYNRPTQDGLVAHFSAIFDAVGLPTIIYNIPSRCGVDLSLAAIDRLAPNPLFVAIKEATGGVNRSADLIARFGDRFQILSGDDAIALPIMALGGHGVISVTSNVAPRQVVELVNAATAGDFGVARACHHRLRALFAAMFVESNPAPAKAALAMLDQMADEVRLPLVAPTAASRAIIRAALSELDLL